jgi:hypothetical protein
VISGTGNSSAVLMLIADGATDGDVQSGYALSGDPQNKLKKAANRHSISWADVWLTALIKEKINTKKPDANKELLTDEYKRILIGEINDISPNVVVPLSELSFNFLTGLTGIRKFRGSVLHPSGNIQLTNPLLRVIPTLGPHPYMYEDPKTEFITGLDFGKIKRNLYATGPIKEVGQVWWAKTAEQVRQFFARHYENILRTGGFVTVDIETFANIPTCIGFCFDGNESCCIPILDYTISLDERVGMLHQVLKLLASPIRKVNQNIKFDWRKLERLGFRVCNVSGDTMLAQACLYCEFPKNLGFLTSLYTDMPYFKDEGKEFDPAKYKREQLYIYNARDCLATHQIYSQQEAELVELGVSRVYQNLITILPIYKEMEENGILVDDMTRKRLLAKYISLYETYRIKLRNLVGREINPLSSTAIGKLVYEELQWKVVAGVKHSKISKKPSADEESLEILMWSSDCNSNLGKAILRTVIDCRKLHKCVEFLSLPTYPDGRHRCEFNLAGAETGRTTASETSDYYLFIDKGKIKLGNMGHSFQTIGKHGFEVDGVTYGKDLRAIFVPSPGYAFVEGDLKSAEARVDAVLARDFDILPIFDTPTGIHRLTGSWVYGCPAEEIRKNDLVDGVDRYHVSKTVRHAGERNMTPQRLMMMIAKEIQFCARILKTFHNNQPNIRQVFHREIREQISRDRVLIAPNGRRRDFFGRIDEETVNKGISQLPQAIVTDYLKFALPGLLAENREWMRPLSEAHDGFLSEVRIGYEEQYARSFRKHVEVPIDFRSCSLSRDYELVIPCECESSTTNWQEIKGLKI